MESHEEEIEMGAILFDCVGLLLWATRKEK